MDGEDAETLRRHNSVYLTVLMRYKEYIEEKESLYVADLPRLVTPGDSAVVAACRNITNSINSYDYEKDFSTAAKMAYDYINSIASISLPIQFWQKPGETISNGAGDPFDKAVLLCSMLIALGSIGSKIVVAIRGESRSIMVYSEFKGKILALDLEKGKRQLDNRDVLINEITSKGSEEVNAYEFNDKMYINIV